MISTSEFLVARRIEVPNYARQPNTRTSNEGGLEAQTVFQPHLSGILEELHLRLEREFNDPDIVFLSSDSGFPVKSELSGDYYVSDVSYSGDHRFHQVIIMFHCLEKTGRIWEGRQPDYDYLGMEMFVYLSKTTGEIIYDGHFTSSSI